MNRYILSIQALTVKTLALILLSCMSLAAFSQSDIRPGFIVTLKGDTLNGLINYKEGFRAYRICDFQTSSNDGMNTFGPSAILAYGLENDKCYESREISLQKDSVQRVFIEVIVRGAVTLYNFQGNFFIQKTGGSLQQLKNGVKETVINGKSMLRATNEYAGILSMTLTECATTRTQIHETRLNEKQLTKLIDDYNRCVGPTSIIYKSSRPRMKLLPGIVAGINSSEVKFHSYSLNDNHLNEPFSKYTSPIIGISLDLIFPRATERISAHAEILFINSKYHLFHQRDPNSLDAATRRYYVSAEFSQLKIPIGVRYTFKGKTLAPYINAGFTTTRNFSPILKETEESEYQGVVQKYYNTPFEFRSDQFGLWGAIGGICPLFKKYSLFAELRYEGTTGITPRDLYDKRIIKSSVTNIGFTLGVRLN